MKDTMNTQAAAVVNRGKPRTVGLRCAFTGHRPQKLPFGFSETDPRFLSFRKRLAEAVDGLIAEGCTHFLSGGALGMDMWAAEIVLERRAKNPGIELEMVSPFDGQASRWSPALRARHDALFAAADIVTVTGRGYSPACMMRRNRYLVSNADILLAAWDGLPGGTAETVAMAKTLGIPVRILPVTEENGSRSA